jgi:hypothetical protein
MRAMRVSFGGQDIRRSCGTHGCLLSSVTTSVWSLVNVGAGDGAGVGGPRTVGEFVGAKEGAMEGAKEGALEGAKEGPASDNTPTCFTSTPSNCATALQKKVFFTSVFAKLCS